MIRAKLAMGVGRAPTAGASAAISVMTRKIPWALLVFVVALFVPAAGSRYYTFLANDVVIWALFATSLNLLVGYTGLVSFGHAAYFGIGAYATGILMKKLGVSFLLAFPAAGIIAGLFALLFGFFCVRLTRIYFAMLTLAFAQIVWAICFKWNELTGGEQGMPEIPYPDFGWIDRVAAFLPFLGGYRTAEHFYFVTLVLVAACLGPPPPHRGLSLRPHARHHPGEPGARRVHRGQRAPLRAGRLRARGGLRGAGRRALRHLQSRASFPTSPTGPSPPRS